MSETNARVAKRLFRWCLYSAIFWFRYNEQQLLKDIEARLSAPIPSLNEDMTLPANIQVYRALQVASASALLHGPHPLYMLYS